MLKEILKTNMIQIVADLCCRLIAIQKIKPFCTTSASRTHIMNA